jgi:hypothetical protein
LLANGPLALVTCRATSSNPALPEPLAAAARLNAVACAISFWNTITLPVSERTDINVPAMRPIQIWIDFKIGLKRGVFDC